jgi:hypothetical protein
MYATTFRYGEITARIANTNRAALAHSVIARLLPVLDALPEAAAYRDAYLLIAAYSSDVQGIDWQPPSVWTATPDALLANYDRLLAQTDPDTLAAWVEMVLAVLRPLAGRDEAPEAALDDAAYAADPSS